MLTPAFELKQDADFLYLNIKAPYTKISEAEVFFEGKEFRFYSKPYFLRLIFPGTVVENGNESASFNADEGSFSIKIPKACPGERFDGLDLQTKLLAPKKKIFAGPLVEVLSSEQNNNADENPETEEDEDFDWEIYQNPYTEEETNNLLLEKVNYGFADEKSNVTLFTRLQEEMPELLDIRHPHLKTVLQRREEKSLTEDDDFDDDHYLADLYEAEDIERICSFEATWTTYLNKLREERNIRTDELVAFSDEEKETMRHLPNKEYLLDRNMKKQCLLGLVDILFAYAYDSRTTEGESTVESAWTINKLSSTLSWLETFTSLETVAILSVKRSLCYPLHRQWNLALLVLKDTAEIMSLGTKFVLKCLLQIHQLFSESEPRHVLNDLYITDYCIWIQTVQDSTLHKLAQALEKISFSKSVLGLDLAELEEAADLVITGEEDGTALTAGLSQQLQALNLGPTGGLPTDDNDDSTSDSSSDQSSTTTDSDDYSSSDNDDSSDEDSDDSESGGEECLLLRNVQSIEKIR